MDPIVVPGGDYEQLRADLEESHKDLEQQQNASAKLQLENEKLMQEKAKLGQQIHDLRRQLSAVEGRQKAALRQRILANKRSMEQCPNIASQQAQYILQIKELREELSAVQAKNQAMAKDQRNLQAKHVRMENQAHQMSAELAEYERLTNREGKWPLNDYDDDDDEYEDDREANRQRAHELRAAMNATGQRRTANEGILDAQQAIPKKRRLDEDDDDSSEEEEEQEVQLAKRFRTTSLEPQAEARHHNKRSTRQAARTGEQRRRDTDQRWNGFKFKLVTEYPTANKITAYDSEKCNTRFPALWEKIDKLSDKWEEWKGTAWFLDSKFLPNPSNTQRVCITSNSVGKRTLWRREDDGRFACERCVAQNIPCFTYIAEADHFRLLPLHIADRPARPSAPKEVQPWLNHL